MPLLSPPWEPAAPIRDWIQFIPGYMQTRVKTSLGLPTRMHEFDTRYRAAGVRVEFEEWYGDWEMQAEWIERLSYGVTPRIMIIAYSWGMGFGAMEFLRALKDRGFECVHLISIDGVYHMGGRMAHRMGASQVKAYYPYSRCTRWMTEHNWPMTNRKLLPPRPKMQIPDNVVDMDWFVQKNSILCGHDLVWEGSGEDCPNRHDVKYRIHSAMDDCPEVWERARTVADNLFLNPTAIAA